VARVVAQASSVIDVVSGHLMLGDALDNFGFYSNGTIHIHASHLTLLDANDAVLDPSALVTLGAGAVPGMLSAANGLTLFSGGQITGYGTIDSQNDATKPLLNRGNFTGNSLAEPLTLTGYVDGAGTFDNVEFTGTFSPGLSATQLDYLGGAIYAGRLDIDLGGLAPGSDFDQLNHIVGNAEAHLGGTLNISLLNDFMPGAGDMFEILTAAGGISGTFASAILPSLSGDLFWNINYGANSVVLAVASPGLAGDFNGDGTVDAADYVVWRQDPDRTQEQYDTWRANFGAPGSGSGTSSAFPLPPSPLAFAVPEPSRAALVLAAIVPCLAASSRSTFCGRMV
jgi:hypothetical protein